MQRKKKSKKKKKEFDRVEFLHTGSHLLNLAGSGGKAKKGGWARGRIINPVGDGSSGKTLLALEACADAFYNIKKKKSKLYPKVKKVTIVYNNKEGVMDFPLERMYGEKFVKAVEWIHSETCEQFGRDYQRRVKALKKGEFLLYVMDSLDSLDSEKSIKRIEKSIKDDKAEDGTYGTEKAKYFSSSFFSRLCSIMKGKDSTLICISQTRQKIGAGMFEEKTYRTGGSALNFYTHQVCWLRVAKKLYKQVRGRKKFYGIRIHAQFKRNKCATPFADTFFDILFNYGIDDIGSMVYWMGYDEKKIKGYEENPDELIEAVKDQWKKDQKKAEPERKGRFES